MKKAITLIVLIFLTGFSIAQVPEIGVLKGKVIDGASNEPVAYATVTIKSAKDSTVITGGITNDKGEFLVDKIKLGEHFAEISFIGYGATVVGPYVFSAQESVQHDAGTVTLGVQSTQIEDVVVETTGPAVRYEVDKKVYDVNQIKAAEGGNAKDVLEQIPSVTVDDQGNVQLRGSGNVRVLVNGRPSSFSLQTLLEQTPQKNIQDVEIITNPSAKYDAEGEVGIINLVLKENNIEGFTGGINANYGTENKYNLGGRAGLKTKKWNLSGGVNLNRFEDDFFRDNLKIQNTNNIQQITDENREFIRNGYSANLGIDHYFDSKNTLFLSGSINPGNGENSSINNNNDVFTSVFDPINNVIYDGLIQDYYSYNRLANGENDRDGYRVTAGFQHDFDGNPSHNVLLDFSYNVGNELQTNSYANNYSTSSYTDGDINDNETSTTLFSGDYTNPFDGKKKLEVGFKSTLEDKDQVFDVLFNNQQDTGASGVLDFDQDVHAGYATFEQTLGKWGLKGGLRAEFTNIASFATGGTTSTYEDDYLEFFPSASARYTINEESSIGANYSRRITRPRSRQITPFADRTDTNNTFVGNNELRPEFTNSYEVSYNKNWKVVTWDASLFHRNTNDHIRFSREAFNDGSSTITFKNIATLNAYGAETSFNIRPTNTLSFNVSGNFNYNEVEDDQSTDITILSNKVFSSKFSSNYRFGKGWSSQLSANYQAPIAYYIGKLSAQGGINLNVNKGGLMKGKANVYLSARDIFNTNGINVTFEDDNQKQILELDWPSQMMFIGFNYNFGNLKKPVKRKQQRRDDSGDDQPSIGLG